MAARTKVLALGMALCTVMQVAFGAAAATAAPQQPQTASLPMRMVLGALGGMGGSSVCHPLDVIRVQMQVDTAGMYKNPLDAATKIVKRDGFITGLYSGISAAYLRQWTYGSCRVGIYAFLLDKVKASQEPGTQIPFWKKLLMGSTSGAIGSMAGLPSEVALVRMSADSKLAPELKRGYKNVGDCIVRISKEEVIVAAPNLCVRVKGTGRPPIRTLLSCLHQMRFVLYICAFALLSGCRSCVDAKGQRASRGPSAWNTHDGNCTHAKEPFLCPPLPSLPRLFARSLHSPLASSVLNASEDINLRAHPFSSLLVFITGREEPLEWRSTNRDPRNPPLLGRPRLLLGDQGAASRQVCLAPILFLHVGSSTHLTDAD